MPRYPYLEHALGRPIRQSMLPAKSVVAASDAPAGAIVPEIAPPKGAATSVLVAGSTGPLVLDQLEDVNVTANNAALWHTGVDWGYADCNSTSIHYYHLNQALMTWSWSSGSSGSSGTLAIQNPVSAQGTFTMPAAITYPAVRFSLWTDADFWQNRAAQRNVVTQEERDAWAQVDAEAQRRREDEARAFRLHQEALLAESKKAKVKAEKLLVKNLSEAQRRTFLERRYFDVQVNGRVYRLHYGTHGNVRQLDAQGREVRSFCIQPDGVPAGDAVLAQKLLLESNEQEFLRIANGAPNPIPFAARLEPLAQ